jgi:hypothetical protein
MLGSLAQALDFPLDTYRSLPAWAKENSSDELRKPKVEAQPKPEAPKSISSANVGVNIHMEKRVMNPSNISNLPQVTTLEDLDLFYSEDTSSTGKLAAPMPTKNPVTSPPTTLEQVNFGDTVAKPVGTAVFGEEEETDEEDSDEDDEAAWKYCQSATAAAQPKAQVFNMADDDEATEATPTAAATATAPETAGIEFSPAPRVEATEATPAAAATANAPETAPRVEASDTPAVSIDPVESAQALETALADSAAAAVGSDDLSGLDDFLGPPTEASAAPPTEEAENLDML